MLGANRYGKSDVRVVKVIRGDAVYKLRDLAVDVALEGDFTAAHTEGDNSGLLATDTMRNTVYALARTHPLDLPRALPGERSSSASSRPAPP